MPNDTVCVASEVTLNNTEGYLKGPWNPSPSDVSHLPGTKACPWTLMGQPGQTIEVSLIDITLKTALNSAEPQNPCPVTLTALDGGHNLELPLCHDSNEREILLCASTTDNIQLYVTQTANPSSDNIFYLLHYKGKITYFIYCTIKVK